MNTRKDEYQTNHEPLFQLGRTSDRSLFLCQRLSQHGLLPVRLLRLSPTSFCITLSSKQTLSIGTFSCQNASSIKSDEFWSSWVLRYHYTQNNFSSTNNLSSFHCTLLLNLVIMQWFLLIYYPHFTQVRFILVLIFSVLLASCPKFLLAILK